MSGSLGRVQNWNSPTSCANLIGSSCESGPLFSPRPICTAGGTVKRQAELFFPAEFADDFPVSLQTSDRYGLIYVVTKLGLLFVYDLETATAVYRNR